MPNSSTSARASRRDRYAIASGTYSTKRPPTKRGRGAERGRLSPQSSASFRRGEGGQAMPPSKLAHVVFQTNRIPQMRDWYCAVLGAEVIYENDHLCFATYDDEHHRVAFLNFGPLAPKDTNTELGVKASEQPGLHHTAFTFASMKDFLDNYVRLRDRGIRPFFCVNHGPTTSMYYRDPDGNRGELQLDNFAP